MSNNIQIDDSVPGPVEAVEAILNVVPSKVQAEQLEPFRALLLSWRVEAQIELIKRHEQYRHPKDKDLTDLDRKSMLDAQLVKYTREYELLKGLEQLVSERISLIREFYGNN